MWEKYRGLSQRMILSIPPPPPPPLSSSSRRRSRRRASRLGLGLGVLLFLVLLPQKAVRRCREMVWPRVPFGLCCAAISEDRKKERSRGADGRAARLPALRRAARGRRGSRRARAGPAERCGRACRVRAARGCGAGAARVGAERSE